MNKQDITNLLIFLNRVNLTGNEAFTLAQIQVKLEAELKKPDVEEKQD